MKKNGALRRKNKLQARQAQGVKSYGMDRHQRRCRRFGPKQRRPLPRASPGGGIYIEDYRDLEAQVEAIAHVDLIEQELLDKTGMR